MNEHPRSIYTVLFIICVTLVIGLIVGGVTLIFSYSGSATSHDVQVQSERSDCRTAYNADFTEVIRHRDNLVDDLVVAIAARDQVTSAALIPQIQAANKQVEDLPKLDDAVTNGYALNGVHHPPCPG